MPSATRLFLALTLKICIGIGWCRLLALISASPFVVELRDIGGEFMKLSRYPSNAKFDRRLFYSFASLASAQDSVQSYCYHIILNYSGMFPG